MVVFIFERVSPSLRGELSRWLIQPKVGVFVGHLSARVRDLLWQKIQQSFKKGSALLIFSDATEQGFTIRKLGDPRRLIEDFEGVLLPKTPLSP